MLEFSDRVSELGFADVLQDPFGIPSSVENLRFGSSEHNRFFSIDLMILELNITSGGNIDLGAFCDFKLLLG